MNESVVIGKDVDVKKGFSSARRNNKSIQLVRDESERQLGSLGDVIGNIRRDGTAPSAESIATELGGRSAAQRAPALLALQQTHGNRYVQRVVAGIQAKLTVGQPGDKYEQEADRVADAVMRMPEPGVQRQVGEEEKEELIQTKPLAEEITSLVQRQVEGEEEEELVQPKLVANAEYSIQRQIDEEEEKEEDIIQTKPLVDQITPLVQRQVEEEEEEEPIQTKLESSLLQRPADPEEEEPIQAKGNNSSTAVVTPGIESSINSLKGSGQPLSESVKSYFEPRFGYDFSGVRVHNDAQANKSAQGLNAKAYTVGRNVVFGTGSYATESKEGKRLLAHELVHTIQQENTGVRSSEKYRYVQRTIGDGHDLSSSRFAGDLILEACYDDERWLKKGNKGPAVKKVQKALIDSGFPLPKYKDDGKFGSETKRAVKMFQRAAGLSGRDVDGIIGPITIKLLDKRVGGTPSDWAKHFNDGIRKLRASSVGFPSGSWRYDSTFWQTASDPDYAAYKPKSGVTPAKAVEKLFENLHLWDLDCSLFPEVAVLYAYRYSLGAIIFNSKFSTLKLRQHGTIGINWESYDVTTMATSSFNRLWNNAPVGSKAMWTNRSAVTIGTAWNHENAIKTKKGTTWQGDRYDAHPIGSNLSEPRAKRLFAEEASDFPYSGSGSAKRAYVNSKIYRHQLQMLINS